jgi:hypothetical protein
MKPDKHKKKDYFRSSRSDYDDMIRKDPKIHQIKDDESLDELASRGSNNLAYRSKYPSNALDRLLRKHIGDKWDDVYSIVVDKIGHDDNLKWRVDLHAFEQDGKIVSIGYCGVQEVRGFYVLNGILGENKISKWKKDNNKVRVTFVEDNVIFKHNGLFFKAPVDKAEVGTSRVFFLTHGSDYGSYHRGETFVNYPAPKDGKNCRHYINARHIRPLNSKEISKWELPNTEINESLRFCER